MIYHPAASRHPSSSEEGNMLPLRMAAFQSYVDGT